MGYRWGLLIGILAISWASILVRWCSLPPLSKAAWRLAIAAAMFMGLALLQGRRPWASFSGRELLLAGLAGILLGVHFATWITSLDYTSVACSLVLVTTSPIFVGLGGRWLLGEPTPPGFWPGLALAAGGAVVVSLADATGPAGSRPALGNGLALAGAVCMAGYLLVGRSLRRIETGHYVAVVYSFAALALVIAAAAARAPLWGYSAQDWLWLALLGLVPQGIGHTMLNWAMRRAPAGTVAVAVLGEPLGSSILAYLLLHERLGLAQAGGGALILLGVSLALPRGNG